MLHGARSYLLQDDNGQTIESHSISAGLDYPGVGPEHSYLHDIGRAEYRPVTDAEAMEAFALLCRTEGIIPAIESAHALAGAMVLGKELGPDALLLVNLSGRGDKDVETASTWFGLGDREEVDPGPGLDTDQQPDRGRGHQRRGRGRARTRGRRREPAGRAHRQGEGRGPGRADRLPPGRLPRRRRARSTAMTAAVEAGADIVEIGVPYSDPGMDGPVIQQAVDVAVRAGVGMRDVLRAVEAVAAAGRRARW